MPTPSLAMRGFIEKGLRHGRPLGGHVTYNTWYSYGTLVDQPSMEAEIDTAAALGVEQFVIDAGWWPGVDPNDPGNWVDGWGNWEVDRDRFPDGLGALSERAHSRGMRFGIWVEPERVTLGTVGRPGLALERYLAMQDSRYDPNAPNEQARSAQVCFADAAARGWVLEKLAAFIDDVHPDYLKWDNNFTVACTRGGHSHGAEDGNFAHVRGVRMVQEALRERYPELDIENCSGGGNRLSLDMLAVTDAAWMDDRTFPSVRTRHGLEGLATVFPPSYLLSLAVTTADEPMTDDPAYDLPQIMRSRMPGILGLSLVAAGMADGLSAALSREIALYKLIRPTMREAGAVLLTPPPTLYPDLPWSGWDAIEYVSPRTGDAVILAFDTLDTSKSRQIWPRALQPYAVYDLESAEYGDLGSATGVELMARGIELTRSGTSRGHVLILRAR
jgi:alpha-galactosidase